MIDDLLVLATSSIGISSVITIFVSAFVSVFINEWLKRPKLELEKVYKRNISVEDGTIEKFSFGIKNTRGLSIIERNTAEKCKAYLYIKHGPNSKGSRQKTFLVFDEFHLDPGYKRKRDIYSGETAEAFSIVKIEGDYYSHNSENNSKHDKEQIKKRQPLNREGEEVYLVVKPLKGKGVRQKIEIDDLEEVSVAPNIGID
ncbi:hypothetical protein GKQ38_00770 [Candidatus Nanohaloarchaea archaeon]|nr:hypothetical protein GKQ38_00770 [Candidatus Nanohaloarchaea archaeon]